ncbi:MAG: Tyrosine recombinase XerC [Syntrophomonadaceae bacterium]|nr:Tyrosine recombinase XerC [Bacillota bacterium]
MSHNKKSKPFIDVSACLCRFVVKGLDFIYVWILHVCGNHGTANLIPGDNGEPLGLRWHNVDLALARISVEENLVRTNSVSTHYQPPKTEKSKEQIPLNSTALDALKDHRKAMLVEGHCSPDKPVFCTKNGTPYIPRNFSRTFKTLRDKANISKDITVHTLRHTFATRLLEAGVSLKKAQELLRHENIATTADVYSNVSVEMKQAAVN